MCISESDVIFEYQTDTNYIPSEEIAYFGGIKDKVEIKDRGGVKSQMSSYINGYKEAVNAMFDRFITEAYKGHISVQDTIVFPLIFTHRHCVELELKRLFCLTDKKFEELSHHNIHQLCKLWSDIKDFLNKRASRLNIEINIKAIEHYIKTIDSFDEGSFRFRYPMDKNLNSNNVDLVLINVVTFHKQMNLFHNTMEKLYFTLNDQVDEWRLDKNFKRQFLYSLKRNFNEINNALVFSYSETQSSDKIWLCPSEIQNMNEEEIKRKHWHCKTVSEITKEVLLILYYCLDEIKLNNIVPSTSTERLIDILKICNDIYDNENIFGENINNSFWQKFSGMVKQRDEIIHLAEEIISLSK